MEAGNVLIDQPSSRREQTSNILDIGGGIENVVQNASAVHKFCAFCDSGWERFIQVKNNISAFEGAVIYRPDRLHS